MSWLRPAACIAALLTLTSVAAGQNLFRQPESAVFDALRERYLISNWQNGDIIAVDSLGYHTNFNTQLTSAGGLEIVGDALFAANNGSGVGGVAKFDLESGNLLWNLVIPGVLLACDITSDGSEFLWLSDRDTPQIKKIRISDQAYSTFAVSGLSLPNGLLYDGANQRILVCSNPDRAPIQAVSLIDSTVSVVAYVPVGMGKFDGLAFDNQNYIYVSSWGYNKVWRYSPQFLVGPQLISSGHNGSADIYFNKRDNVLVVPNILANTVSFIAFPDTDGDGLMDLNDNCPQAYNAEQEDTDLDQIGDSCDMCPGYSDGDDFDSDAVPDSCDNCPEAPNGDQYDLDYDAVGDECDNCLLVYNPEQEDRDLDGIGDTCDGCCVARLGDANGVGGDDPTIGDVSQMIDALFITASETVLVTLPACMAEADVNLSSQSAPAHWPPVFNDITIGDISALIDALFITADLSILPNCP